MIALQLTRASKKDAGLVTLRFSKADGLLKGDDVIVTFVGKKKREIKVLFTVNRDSCGKGAVTLTTKTWPIGWVNLPLVGRPLVVLTQPIVTKVNYDKQAEKITDFCIQEAGVELIPVYKDSVDLAHDLYQKSYERNAGKIKAKVNYEFDLAREKGSQLSKLTKEAIANVNCVSTVNRNKKK